MVHLTFTSPGNLWFAFVIPALILIHFITLRYTKQKAFKFANYEIIERISGGVVLTKNITLLVIRVIIITCFVLAASGTILHYTGYGTSLRFVLAIDASSSMTAQDLAPTRLEAAKEAAKVFIDNIGYTTQTGIISFAGSALVHQSITNNIINVKNAIDEVQILAIGGTDIGEALVTGVNMFESENSDGGKAIILLTDGRSNIGIAIDRAILYANKANIAIHTIGIGTVEGGLLKGTNVTLRLDESSLKNIAIKTNGEYYRAQTKEQLIESYKSIANMGQNKISKHLSAPLLLVALVLLLIEWGLINTKFRTLP